MLALFLSRSRSPNVRLALFAPCSQSTACLFTHSMLDLSLQSAATKPVVQPTCNFLAHALGVASPEMPEPNTPSDTGVPVGSKSGTNQEQGLCDAPVGGDTGTDASITPSSSTPPASHDTDATSTGQDAPRTPPAASGRVPYEPQVQMKEAGQREQVSDQRSDHAS